MRNLLVIILLLPLLGTGQTIKDIDYISPFHNEVVAVKKGSEWVFINKERKDHLPFNPDTHSHLT